MSVKACYLELNDIVFEPDLSDQKRQKRHNDRVLVMSRKDLNGTK